jgi:hypothetical protein
MSPALCLPQLNGVWERRDQCGEIEGEEVAFEMGFDHFESSVAKRIVCDWMDL